MILIVARHSLRNLLRGELAVILGMQNVGERTRIRGHCLKSSLSSQCGHRGNPAAWEVLPMPVENNAVLRRVGWGPAFGPAGRDSACRNSEETLAEQQAIEYCTAGRLGGLERRSRQKRS